MTNEEFAHKLLEQYNMGCLSKEINTLIRAFNARNDVTPEQFRERIEKIKHQLTDLAQDVKTFSK